MDKSTRRYLACSESYTQLRRSQTRGYRSGLALQKHMDATHGGVFTPTCPACVEVERKTREARTE